MLLVQVEIRVRHWGEAAILLARRSPLIDLAPQSVVVGKPIFECSLLKCLLDLGRVRFEKLEQAAQVFEFDLVRLVVGPLIKIQLLTFGVGCGCEINPSRFQIVVGPSLYDA